MLSSVTGLILAGGKGSRMGGVDKGLQTFRGKRLVDHVYERFAPQVGGIIINANQNHEEYKTFGVRVVSDAIGQPVSIAEARHEQAGASISLTLDANIQQRAEDVLSAVGKLFHPKDSTAIVMDPRTGAILAMANWPLANANHPGPSATEALQDRAVSFNYEPGSTFKAFTVSGAIQEKLVTPDTGFEIPNQIRVADRTIHDDTEHPAESLTTSQILAQSSNVGAIKIGFKVGTDRLSEYVQRFGFGHPVSPDFPGENSGIVWRPDKWTDSALASVSMGYQVGVTPLQMLAAVSSVASATSRGSRVPACRSAASSARLANAPSCATRIRTSAAIRRAGVAMRGFYHVGKRPDWDLP